MDRPSIVAFFILFSISSLWADSRPLRNSDLTEDEIYEMERREYLKKYLKNPDDPDALGKLEKHSEKKPKNYRANEETGTIDFNNIDVDQLRGMSPEQLQQILNQINDKNAKLMEGQKGNSPNIKQMDQSLDKTLRTLMDSQKMIGGGDSAGAQGMRDLVYASLKTFQTLPEKDLKKHILDRTNGSALHKVFLKCDKCLTFSARYLKDKEAFPKMAEIPANRKMLTYFLIGNIIIFILKFLIKRRDNKKYFRWQQKMAASLRRFILVMGSRIGLFLYFLGPYFKPSYDVFKSVFLA